MNWLLPAHGLIGFVTPAETITLHRAFLRLGRRVDFPLAGSARRRRRGGLLGACARFVRRLLDRGPGPEEMYRLLCDLVEEAVRNDEGLAVIAS